VVPIRDDIPSRSVAYITYILILLNVVVFIYELSLGEGLDRFLQVWALVPVKLTKSLVGQPTGLPFPAWVTLFTSQFLHSGFLHLGGNMLFLWVFGNNVEDALGKVKYLLFYLSCGALAALAQWIFSADSMVPTVGASGAIAGVLGGYIIKYPHAKVLTLVPLGFIVAPFRIPAVFFLGFWFLQQAFYSVASLGASTQTGGIAYWAHAGGFVAGAALGALLGLFRRKR
jgi:membrane associated rhomboid family serine protease